MKRFEGKTIVVTGGANGIGAETVRRLHGEGAAVLAVDLNAADIERAFGRADDRLLAFEADVTNRDRHTTLRQPARTGQLRWRPRHWKRTGHRRGNLAEGHECQHGRNLPCLPGIRP